MTAGATSEVDRFRTTVTGIVWPPLVDGLGALVAAYAARLNDTQWLAPHAIEAGQRAQLAALAEHLYRHSPQFARRLDAAGMAPADLGRPGALQSLPPLTRRELQSATDLHCAVVPEDHEPCGISTTSGSTGEPVVVRRTSLNQISWLAMTLRDHQWQQRDAGLRLAALSAHHASLETQPDWGAPCALIYRTGEMMTLPASIDIGQLREALCRFRPGVLVIYPSMLAGLLEAMDSAEDFGLGDLAHVRCLGETVSDELRARALAQLGLRIEDAYSSQECGYLALQCPDASGFHVMAETHIVEVVDEAGRPCAPGEMGRILVTDLQNFATPLIRYEIGDWAIAGEPCSCGRGLPKLKQVVGRERNLVRKPDGTRHWPLIGFARFRSVAPVRQYQLIQHDLARIEVRLVVERPLTASEEADLGRLICEALDHPFSLEFHYCDDRLDDVASGKFEEFVCRVV